MSSIFCIISIISNHLTGMMTAIDTRPVTYLANSLVTPLGPTTSIIEVNNPGKYDGSKNYLES